jgi:uncharacterized protein YggE
LKKRTWYLAIGGLLALVAAIVLVGGLSPGVAHAQEVDSGIVVVGEGTASGSPDIAYVSLGVQSEAKTAREAIDANSSTMTKVIEAVKQAGIPENKIRTSGLSLTPVTAAPRPGEETPQTVAYRAHNMVTVTVEDIKRTAPVLDAGIAAGANALNGVQFSLKDATALRRQALEAAAQQARSKAESLAGALGLRITGIRLAEEQGGDASPLARPEMAAAADAGGASVPVQTGELTVVARVRVTFNYA